MTIKKNGNGTFTISKWFWIVWTIVAVLISFSVSFALTRYQVEQNRNNIESITQDIKEINQNINKLTTNVECIKYALGIKD